MFAWAPVPRDFVELGSLAFAKLLLSRAKVAVSPGTGFGEYGEGHVRLALVENTQRIRQAVRNIRSFLGQADRLVEAARAERRAVAESIGDRERSTMSEPLKIAIARLGTVGRGTLEDRKSPRLNSSHYCASRM